MLVLKERVLGVPIMSLQTGEEIARTSKPIIDPRRLSIVAFYCEGPRLDYSPAILHVDDIREISNLGYIVNSAENIMPPDDLVRLQEILDFKFDVLDKQVVEDTGQKVGKVSDYAVDTNTFLITQLHATPGIWKALQTTDVIIGRQQIVEINDTTIVVKSATVPVQQKSIPHTAPVADNPFRRPHAQPETSTTTRGDQAPL